MVRAARSEAGRRRFRPREPPDEQTASELLEVAIVACEAHGDDGPPDASVVGLKLRGEVVDSRCPSASADRARRITLHDAIVRFTEESAFAGAGVVFEAQREAGYSVQRALDELHAARRNRNAAAGVFVMARSHASETFPRFSRYRSNVVIVWDDQAPTTDPYLHAAILLGIGLVTRMKTAGQAGDIAALRDVEARVEAELSRLERQCLHPPGRLAVPSRSPLSSWIAIRILNAIRTAR